MTGVEKMNVVLFNHIAPCGSSAGSSSVSVDYKRDGEILEGIQVLTRYYLEVSEQVGRMLDQRDSDGMNRVCQTNQ